MCVCLFMSAMRRRVHAQENQGKHGEDEGLDKSDKQFQKHKRQGYNIGGEESYYNHEHLPGEDVAEKTEGEGNDFRKLRNKLQNPDKEHNRIAEVEEFAEMRKKSELDHAKHVGGDYRDESDSECEIQIGCRRTEERHHPLFTVEDDGTDSRQKPEPVGCDDEKEDSGDER